MHLFKKFDHSINQVLRNSNTLMLTSGQNLAIHSCEENDTKWSKKSCHTAGAGFYSAQMNFECNVSNDTLHSQPYYDIYNL
jgi:hypothetical protein